MATLNDIDRIVLRHGWHESREWARAVDELADLSDGEIERLVENTHKGGLSRPAGVIAARAATHSS